MKRFVVNLILWLICYNILTNTVTAQISYYGGKGLLRVMDAGNLRPGMFYVNSNLLTFLKARADNMMIKDHTLTLGLTLGISQTLELIGQLVPYQDDQSHWGKPANVTLGMKCRLTSTKWSDYGLAATVIIPTVIDRPVIYEPYISGKYGWQLRGLVAYDLRYLIPAFPMKLYFNVGFFDQDFHDTYFTKDIDQILLGAAIKFPVRSALLYTEYTAEIFINDTTVSYQENSIRVTQGFRFIGPWNLIMDLAVDLSLTHPMPDAHKNVNEYASWKLIIGFAYQKRLYQPLTKEEKQRQKIREMEEKKLEQIRREREKATRDLEKMKKELERERKKETQSPDEPE